jgi:imidazoleglycerol-phosphate dehydratase
MKEERLGLIVEKASIEESIVKRRTKESLIIVKVKFGKRRKNKVNTPIEFLNHMIEHISLNGGFNVDISYKATGSKLTHVIAEDTGIVLGKALQAVLLARVKKIGIKCQGSNVKDLKTLDMGILDEAGAIVAVSVEGRGEFNFKSLNPDINITYLLEGKVEDMNACDLDDFLKGISLGMGATINVYILSGIDPHHTWESIFRGLGKAIGEAFEEKRFLKGRLAAVKGIID